MVDTDDYRLCCLVKHVSKCTAQKLWHFSCTSLLGNTIVKFMFYIISITIVILNTLSFLIQKRKKISHFELLVKVINVLNVVQGISMVILWVVDLYFDDDFPLYETKWRSNTVCFILFALDLWFSIMSPLLLTFISVQRYLGIMFPMEAKHKDFSISKYMAHIFILSIILTTVITNIIKEVHTDIPVALCTPFFDPTESIFLIKILTCFVVILQFTANIIIIMVYTLLYKRLQYQGSLKIKKSKKQSLKNFRVQSVIIVASNILCWFPSSVSYLTPMFLNNYSVDVILWTKVVIAPLNCLVNPIVFNVRGLKEYLNSFLKVHY